MEIKINSNLIVSDYLIQSTNGVNDNLLVYDPYNSNFFTISTTKFQNYLNLKNIENLNENEINTFKNINLFSHKDFNKEIIQSFIKNNKLDNYLSLVLHTTSNCQFGCSYCGQTHSSDKITNNTIDNLLKFVNQKFQDGTIKNFNCVWHGAEPLLGTEGIIELSKHFLEFSNKYNSDYEAVIITNGLILKTEIFYKLYQECKITTFQITLDGDKEYHDKKRYLKSGGETFEIIFNNLIKIKKIYSKDLGYEYIFLIRINIDSKNVNGVFDLIKRFADHNMQDYVYFRFLPVENYGDNKSKDSFGISTEFLALKEIDYFLYAIKLGFRFGTFLPEEVGGACLATGYNSFAMDVFGNLFSCYTFPYTKHEFSKLNKIGNINDPVNKFNKDVQLRNFYNDVLDDKFPCSKCNLLPVCGGHCPLQWYEGNIPCPTFKYNIEDRMVLEYLNKTNQLNKDSI